jgi:integrase/recombinase XerD
VAGWTTFTPPRHAAPAAQRGLFLLRRVQIAAYLRRGRPTTDSRRVFLRSKAPTCAFRGASGVGSLVRHSLERAGIHAATKGTHQFRHGLATEMLRQGASLGEIGELLGHRHSQTTKIYTKVDIKALRTLALPWPGGVR